MKVADRSTSRHLVLPLKTIDGRDALSVIVKYSFRVTSAGLVEALEGDDAIAPRGADVAHGDPAKSSLAKPSDVLERKPGTEILLVAQAYPERAADSSVDVSLAVGPIAKTLRVHGLRVWQRGTFGGIAPGPARPLGGPVPVRYELAWGGFDLSDPAKPIGEPGNTVGRGAARDAASLVGAPAAQIEYPNEPVGGRKNVVAGFGPLHRHWQPRVRFAGTYDAAWETSRMPLLPVDFDARFWLSAPADQWTATPLGGDEVVLLKNLTADGTFRFRLPRVRPRIRSLAARVQTEHRPHLDTVLVDADARTFETTFHAVIPLPGKLQALDEIRIEDAR